MSPAVLSAAPTAPSERSIEELVQRLEALRAEIDTILSELVRHGAAMPREPAAASEPDVSESQTVLEPTAATDAADAATEAVATADDAATDAPQTPAAIEPAAAEIDEASTAAIDPAADAPAPAPASDAAPAADTTASSGSERDPAEIAAETSTGEAPAAPQGLEPSAQLPAAAPAGGLPAPAEAAVIPLASRSRKEKAELATTTVRARTGRHGAAKVAAGLVALIMAGTLLMAADRAALGDSGLQQLLPPLPSYMPSLPAPAGSNWYFFDQWRGLAPSPPQVDTPVRAGTPAGDGAALRRYFEIWPSRS